MSNPISTKEEKISKKKDEEKKPKRKRTKDPTIEDLVSKFHLSLKEAAHEIGLCPTLFKKTCRTLGIARWPHRKVQSINSRMNYLDKLLTLKNLSKEDEEVYRIERESLIEKKNFIFENPTQCDRVKIGNTTNPYLGLKIKTQAMKITIDPPDQKQLKINTFTSTKKNSLLNSIQQSIDRLSLNENFYIPIPIDPEINALLFDKKPVINDDIQNKGVVLERREESVWGIPEKSNFKSPTNKSNKRKEIIIELKEDKESPHKIRKIVEKITTNEEK